MSSTLYKASFESPAPGYRAPHISKNIYLPKNTAMKILDVIHELEALAPPSLQESYDNAGLITGNASADCTGIIVSLDCIETVVQEAIDKGCNMIVSHHPIIFSGLKTITGKNYVERTIIAAIKNDIAIYAIHTNLDNVLHGVNKMMADRLGLINLKILAPKKSLLKKIVVFVPHHEKESVAAAMFAAGAGRIGNYYDCSFSSIGEGKFTPGEGTKPTVGQIHVAETVQETKLEMIFPAHRENAIVAAMKQHHSYEEVAHDIYPIGNSWQDVGSGMQGELAESVPALDFLQHLKKVFGLKMLKHTKIHASSIKTVALCGGAGSFLVKDAINSKSDIYISSDFKYHEFFDADDQIIIADIGHFESERFTIDLLHDYLREKFTTFAVLKTTVNTNPVSWL